MCGVVVYGGFARSPAHSGDGVPGQAQCFGERCSNAVRAADYEVMHAVQFSMSNSPATKKLRREQSVVSTVFS